MAIHVSQAGTFQRCIQWTMYLQTVHIDIVGCGEHPAGIVAIMRWPFFRMKQSYLEHSHPLEFAITWND